MIYAIPGIQGGCRGVVDGSYPGKRWSVTTAAIAPVTAVPAVIATIPLPGRPVQIVVSPDSRHVYVATETALQVIRTSDQHVATLPVPGAVKSVAAAADGSWLYVRSYDGSLSIIDAAGRTVCTVPGPPSSADVVGADGKLLFAAHRGWISATDTDGTVIGAVTIEAEITGLAVSSDGNRLYAATCERDSYSQYPRGALHELDISTGTVERSIDVGVCPRTVTLSPDRSSAYVTHHDTCSVSDVELATGTVTPIRLGDAPLSATMSPDGRWACVTNEGSVSVVDTATRDVRNVLAGESPRGLAVSPDGARAYVTDFGGQAVSVIDIDRNAVAATVAVDGHPEAVAVSPHGLLLYVGDYWSASLSVISTSAADSRLPAGALEIAS